MEVRLTPEQETGLAALAEQTGREAEQIIQDAVVRLLNDARFEAEVKKGYESIDRGEWFEHEEVRVALDRLIASDSE